MDWDSALREDNGRVNRLGIFDLDRHIRPVGRAFKEPIRRWQDTLLLLRGRQTLVGHGADEAAYAAPAARES